MDRQVETGLPEIYKDSCRGGARDADAVLRRPRVRRWRSVAPSSHTHPHTGVWEHTCGRGGTEDLSGPPSHQNRHSAWPRGQAAAQHSRPRSVLSAGVSAGRTDESQVTEHPLSCVSPQCGEPRSGFGLRSPLGGAGWPGRDKPDDVA